MWVILIVVLAVVLGYFLIKRGCPLCGPKEEKPGDKKGGSCCS